MTKPHDCDENREHRKHDDTLHQVVVFGVPDDPHELRDVLSRELGLSHTDAQIQVHNLPGVLPDVLPTHESAKLAQAIRELGVNATAIPADQVPELSKFTTIHHLCCDQGGLEIIDLRDEIKTTVAWRDVVLLSVGIVPHRYQHRAGPVPTVATSLATSHSGEHATPVQRGSLELLVIASHPLRAFRIDHAEFNYEYLGDRMSSSGTVNFRWLIQDLVNRAASANVTPATRSFLEHGLARHYEFSSFDELRRYTIFHLIIRDSAWGSRIDAADAANHAVRSSKNEPASRSNKPSSGNSNAVKADT